MMKKFLIFLIFLISLSCIDWKSKFYKSQMELAECLRIRSDSLVIMDDVITRFPGESISNDTITIYGKTDEVKTDITSETILPSFTRKRQYIRGTDSLKAWISIENILIEDQFIQRIKLDSIKYPVKTVIKTRDVPIKIDKTNYWKPIAISAIIASIILIVGFFVQLRRK